MTKPKDKSVIPHGAYCYNVNGKKGIDEETGLPTIGVDVCPYWEIRQIIGIDVCWCAYLDKGSMFFDDHITEEEYHKLSDHFGGWIQTQDALPLLLLFDQCKCCDENWPKEEQEEFHKQIKEQIDRQISNDKLRVDDA